MSAPHTSTRGLYVRYAQTEMQASHVRTIRERGRGWVVEGDASRADSIHDLDNDAKVSVTRVRYRPALGIIYPLPLLIEATSFLPPEALPLSQPPSPIRFHHCN